METSTSASIRSLPPGLPRETKLELLELLTEKQRRQNTNRLSQLYPETGPYRRQLYPKHMEFLRLGKEHQERAFMAANRVGKTWGAGGFETALHLTGLYPEWWEGRRFEHPVDVWAAGDTSETTRDIVQKALLGSQGELGTGLIPGRCIIGEPSKRMGVSGAVDTALVQHTSGGVSQLGFKSYDQGRKKFQGTAKHLIWLDEECDMDIYSECMMRLMTTDGMMMLTFTPLQGLSDVALMFLPEMAPTVA